MPKRRRRSRSRIRSTSRSLSTVIASEIELRAGERYSVIAPSQVRSILRQEVQKQLAGEMTSGVSEQLVKALSSDLIATSSVTSVGGEWVFSLELVDTATAQVLSRQSVSYLGEPAGLVELVRPYVARLIDGTEAEEYRGNLEVLVNEEEARVVLDERELGLSPVTRVGELPIGRHRVSVTKDGYVPLVQDVVVQHNETALLQANLIDEASLVPWWQKWWFWTAVGGGLIAGGILAAVVASDGAGGTLVIDQTFTSSAPIGVAP
jgi:hypothetical protein